MADKTKLLQDALEALERAKRDSLRRDKQLDEDRKHLIISIGKDILGVLHPLLERISENSKINKEEIKQAISESTIKVDVKSEKPIVNVEVPDIYVPEPKVTVNVPDVIVPEIKMPEEMDIKGWVRLQGVDLNNPLPVQLRDAKGNPVNLFENLTTIVSQGGGGNMRGFIQIKGVTGSTGADLLNADNRLRVSVETGGSGLTDSEL